MRRFVTTGWTSLSVAAIVMLAGCSSDPDPSELPPPPLPPVAEVPTSTPADHDELDAGLRWIVDEAMDYRSSPGLPTTYAAPVRVRGAGSRSAPTPVPAPRTDRRDPRQPPRMRIRSN